VNWVLQEVPSSDRRIKAGQNCDIDELLFGGYILVYKNPPLFVLFGIWKKKIENRTKVEYLPKNAAALILGSSTHFILHIPSLLLLPFTSFSKRVRFHSSTISFQIQKKN
jgi:hypothetical protein